MPFLCLIYITHFHMLIFTCCSLHENKHVISHCSYNRGVFLSFFNPKISLKNSFIQFISTYCKQINFIVYVCINQALYHYATVYTKYFLPASSLMQAPSNIRNSCATIVQSSRNCWQRFYNVVMYLALQYEFLGNSKVHYSQF